MSPYSFPLFLETHLASPTPFPRVNAAAYTAPAATNVPLRDLDSFSTPFSFNREIVGSRKSACEEDYTQMGKSWCLVTSYTLAASIIIILLFRYYSLLFYQYFSFSFFLMLSSFFFPAIIVCMHTLQIIIGRGGVGDKERRRTRKSSLFCRKQEMYRVLSFLSAQ
jgi:hypothetical protein